MSDDDLRPHLDHVFLTVDSTTLSDIQESALLSEEQLGRFRIKHASSTLIGPYRTVNVAGQSTFIEFFPASAPPFPGISLGIVMSFERPGQSLRARQRLELEGIPVRREMVWRSVEGSADPQPWYRLLRPEFGDDSPFTLFLSEITPEYFKHIGAQCTPDGHQTREAYLTAAMKAPQAEKHYFEDLRRVTLCLSEQRSWRLRAVLEALGHVCKEEAGRLLLQGPSGVLDVVIDDRGGEGLRQLDISLTRPFQGEPRVLRFGNRASLELSPLGDATARWSFASKDNRR